MRARRELAVNSRRTVTCLNRSSARRSNEFAQRGSRKSAKPTFQVKMRRVNVSQFFKENLSDHSKIFREPDCSDWRPERFRMQARPQKKFDRQASRSLLRLRRRSLLEG